MALRSLTKKDTKIKNKSGAKGILIFQLNIYHFKNTQFINLLEQNAPMEANRLHNKYNKSWENNKYNREAT